MVVVGLPIQRRQAMVHIPQGGDFSSQKNVSVGQVLLLVMYVFAGSVLTLTASSALAAFLF